MAVRAGVYATVADVLAAVDREQPDLAFLFSSYLYVVNRISSAEGLETLIQGLCTRGCRVVTSDPFLGLMAKLDGDTFVNHPQSRLLTDSFARVFAVLKPLPHLYLAELNEPAEATNVAFFNPQILVPPTARARFEQTVRHNLGTNPPAGAGCFCCRMRNTGRK